MTLNGQRIYWGNEGGAHAIYAVGTQGEKKIFALGNQQKIAGLWARLKARSGVQTEEMSWSGLGEGMRLQDKMAVFEEYHTKGSLTESVDHETKQYFESLHDLAHTPKAGSRYMVVPLALIGPRAVLLDPPSKLEFVGAGREGLEFVDAQGQTRVYPSREIRERAIYNTFTFGSADAYDKFRTAVSVKFDLGLPDIDGRDLGEAAIPEKCWPGYKKVGTKPGTGRNRGRRVNDCEKIDEQGVSEGLEDSAVQQAIIDTVERLFRKNEIGDYSSLEAVRQGVKHHFSKPGATAESAIDGILNILTKRMSKSGNYVDLGRFKEALRQGVAHQLKKQDISVGTVAEANAPKRAGLVSDEDTVRKPRKNQIVKGSKVYHSLYGSGTVVDRSTGPAADHWAEVKFLSGPTRKVNIKSLRLEKQPDLSESDISGILGAASLVRDYIVTAEVDGREKKFRVRGVTGPRAARERFLTHHNQAKVISVDEEGREDVQKGVAEALAEGYSLKKTNVSKYTEPGDPDEYTQDINVKDVDYEIINNKTGQVVGTASWTTNDFFGPGALKITMNNGATRWLDIWEREKGNPQSAFNRFVKDPKTSKKYVAEGQQTRKITMKNKQQISEYRTLAGWQAAARMSGAQLVEGTRAVKEGILVGVWDGAAGQLLERSNDKVNLSEGWVAKNGSKYLKGSPASGERMTWVSDIDKATVFRSKGDISKTANMRGWTLVSAEPGKEKEVSEGIEDKLEAARERAAAKGRTVKGGEEEKSSVRKVAGHAYGGSKAKDEPADDGDDDDTTPPSGGAPKKRGRPAGGNKKAAPAPAEPKRRGRPPGSGKKAAAAAPAAPKKRGRPRKVTEGSVHPGDLYNAVIEYFNGGRGYRNAMALRKKAESGMSVDRLAKVLNDFSMKKWGSRLDDSDAVDAVKNIVYPFEFGQGVSEGAKMTAAQKGKREDIVKSMKGDKEDFEKRYGKRGEEVMYATATKMAKKAVKESREAKPDFLDLDKDGDKKEPMKKAAQDAKDERTDESKPDFLDLDKDGDKKEPMKKAAQDAKDERTDESLDQIKQLAGLTNTHKSADTLMSKYTVSEGVVDTVKGLFGAGDKKDAGKPAEKPVDTIATRRTRQVDQALRDAGVNESDFDDDDYEDDSGMSRNEARVILDKRDSGVKIERIIKEHPRVVEMLEEIADGYAIDVEIDWRGPLPRGGYEGKVVNLILGAALQELSDYVSGEVYESKQGVAEGLDSDKRSRLDDLIDQYRDATDPEAYYDLDDEYGDPDLIIAQIKQEFGDNVANKIEAGAYKMHFGRQHHSIGNDPYDWKKSPRVTRSGKINKQDSDTMKRGIKSKLGVSEGVNEDVNLNITANGEEDVVKMIQKLSGIPAIIVPGHTEPAPSSGCAMADAMSAMSEEYDNSPDETVYGVDSAFPTGDDLASKGREAPKVNGGGNPMTTMEGIWRRYQDMIKDADK
jgi:hypothetical protein